MGKKASKEAEHISTSRVCKDCRETEKEKDTVDISHLRQG